MKNRRITRITEKKCLRVSFNTRELKREFVDFIFCGNRANRAKKPRIDIGTREKVCQIYRSFASRN